MSVIISLSIWKEAWRIASGFVLRASTSEGPEENKERTGNLIIISYLFRELMWCLRCQAVLFLSHSVLLLPSLIPLPSSLSFSYSHPLCFVPEISPYSRGFDESLSRQNVTVWNVILRSDVSKTRPVISFGTLDFISVLFSFTSAFTNTIAQLNHLWPASFFPLIFYKENYPIPWKDSSYILQVVIVLSFILTFSWVPLVYGWMLWMKREFCYR